MTFMRRVLARLAVTSEQSNEDKQRILDQQKVIEGIQQRLDIAPEQNQGAIKEELLKAKNKLADIRKSIDLKNGDSDGS